jgi:transcriptional regulator of met regulon
VWSAHGVKARKVKKITTLEVDVLRIISNNRPYLKMERDKKII